MAALYAAILFAWLYLRHRHFGGEAVTRSQLLVKILMLAQGIVQPGAPGHRQSLAFHHQIADGPVHAGKDRICRDLEHQIMVRDR